MAGAIDTPKPPTPGEFKLSVLLPPTGSAPQLLSPDQSGDPFGSAQFRCRGRRLLPDEEWCLVDLCTAKMHGLEINGHRKCFWEMISVSLYNEIKRPYSWQSCKRRMGRLIEAYQAYHDKVPMGTPTGSGPLLEREYKLMPANIRERLGRFIAWDAEQTCCAMAEDQAKLDKEKAEVLGQFEGYRQQKLARVQNWLDSLPAIGRMRSAEADNCAVRPTKNREQDFKVSPEYQERLRQMESRQRNRSRSPCRGERNYRQRSFSPVTIRPAQKAKPVQARNGMPADEPSKRDAISIEDNSTPVQSTLARKMPQKPSQTESDLVKLASAGYFKSAATEFSEDHMHPLIMKLTANNPAVRDESLELMDEACRAMFQSMMLVTTKFLTEAFELKPRIKQ